MTSHMVKAAEAYARAVQALDEIGVERFEALEALRAIDARRDEAIVSQQEALRDLTDAARGESSQEELADRWRASESSGGA